MTPEGAIFHKPKSFISAKNLIYCSIFIGVLTAALGYALLGFAANGGILSVIVYLITFGLEIFLVKGMAFCKKWARTTYLVLFILGMISLPFYLIVLFKVSLLLATLSVVQAAMQFIAVFFLFTKESNEWFRNTTDGTLP